jgi:hypothetical protein
LNTNSISISELSQSFLRSRKSRAATPGFLRID